MKDCSLRPEFCERHGFYHGKEAEELRRGIEIMMHEVHADEDFEGRVYASDVYRRLADLLDRVDARDSLAYVENGCPCDEQRDIDDDRR